MAVPTAYSAGSTTGGNKYNNVVEAFYNDIGQSYLWEMIANLDIQNAAAKRVYAENPVGDIPTWNGTSDLTAIATGATHTTSVSGVIYGGRITHNEIDVRRDPALISTSAARLAEATKRKFEKLVFTRLMAAFTETVDDGNESTTEVCSAAHKITGAASQSNLLTSALTASTLGDAREVMAGWKSWQNEPLGLDKYPMVLVVNPANGDLARRLVGSPQHFQSVGTASGGATGAQINPMNQGMNPERSITVLESAYAVEAGGDTDSWFLMNKAGADKRSPLTLWLPTLPDFQIMRDAKSRLWEISVVFEALAHWRAPVDGIVGSNPT